MEGKLVINNYLEDIVVNFKNMIEEEAKQVAYYLLQSNEWRGLDRLCFDEDLLPMVKVNIEKDDSIYKFGVVYKNGIASKELVRKVVKGFCPACDPEKLLYIMYVNEEVNGIKVRNEQIVIEKYEIRDSILIRTSIADDDVRKEEALDNNVLSLEQYAIEDFDNISLSHSKKSQPSSSQKKL